MPKTRGSVQIKEEEGVPRQKVAKKIKQEQIQDETDRKRIIELLNDAALEPDPARLLDILSEIKERIVFKVRF